VLGAAAVLLLSRRTTRPILDITGIACVIARMHFSPRYRGRRRYELGTLGESINTIAERLSGTIGELKAANGQLRHEMLMQNRFLASATHDCRPPRLGVRPRRRSVASTCAWMPPRRLR
jgi:two-component system sensor histidine kinase VanS